MKNIIVTLLLISSILSANAQINIVDVDSGASINDAPSGTYIKDINNIFIPFLGTWVYQNGNEILTIKIEKVTQYFYSEYGTYQDFIKGNYSYTQDGGVTYVTNTIVESVFVSDINNRDLNPLYAPGPLSSQLLEMRFTDKLYEKNCNAIFTFLPSSTTQMNFKLMNVKRGFLETEIIPNQNFSVPNNVILTKQP